MKSTILGLGALALALSVPTLGLADVPVQATALTTCGGVTYTNGQTRVVTQDLTGKLCTNTSSTVSGNVTVVQPTAANLNATIVGTGTFADQATLQAGTAIAGKFGIDQTTAVTTNGVVIAPTATAGAGIAPVVSASAEANHVFKGSAGNLYSAYVTTGATAGYLLIFDATSAPGDGAVTPIHCIPVSSNSTVGINFTGPPEVYATGITASFSTSGCFTKAASATAFFHGSAK